MREGVNLPPATKIRRPEMAYTLAAPITKKFKLEEADETGETTVTFRQASVREDEARASLMADQVYSWDDEQRGKVERRTRWSWAELHRLEVQMTMDACDIMVEKGEDKDGNPSLSPLFKFNRKGIAMSESQFMDAWGQLPSSIARELIMYCHEVNPDWRVVA